MFSPDPKSKGLQITNLCYCLLILLPHGHIKFLLLSFLCETEVGGVNPAMIEINTPFGLLIISPPAWNE